MVHSDRKPLGIEDYGLIGDMHSCALVGIDGSIDFCCWPTFDSPSLFARILDTTAGGCGHWSVKPTVEAVVKQNYIPATNILQTKWINAEGVIQLKDFFVIRKPGENMNAGPTLIRQVECIRGHMHIEIELAPAPNYAQPSTSKGDRYTIEIEGPIRKTPGICQSIRWTSADKKGLIFDVQLSPSDDDEDLASLPLFGSEYNQKVLCDSVKAILTLTEGQRLTMVLHNEKWAVGTIRMAAMQVQSLLCLYLPQKHVSDGRCSILWSKKAETITRDFWTQWAHKSTYRGARPEQIQRSLLCLKLLTYQPTGAIIAAPTLSLPESIGGGRNWDYRYSWVRDSSFTVYVFLKLGYTEEAEAYMNFIFERITHWQQRKEAGGAAAEHLPLMFRIDGTHILDEVTLEHFGGYKDSTPVRIGNGASTHVQLDIYGELMDAIYLFNKHGKPITYDQWLLVRKLVDHAQNYAEEPDMSIWEVRGKKEQFTYSKIMLWVAFDRGLRLADKRNFPCPQRMRWMSVRDLIYETIMERGYNKQMNSFIQSYESNTQLDASSLIAPLVFFIAPNDPRFLGTLERILRSPSKGGLTSAGFVFRYDTEKVDDGVGGSEGTFTICTMWLIEALTRAAKYQTGLQAPDCTVQHKTQPHKRDYLQLASDMFENVTSFANHLGLFSEEIAVSGEQLGNTPQAFSHLAYVSAALNLDRVKNGGSGI